MSDIYTVRTAIQSALDEADAVAGTRTVAQQLAVKDLLIAALQSKIDAARVKAQADKDADAASVAGQGVLDALT